MTTTAGWRQLGERIPRLGGGLGGARGFLSWWGRSLMAWLPRRWRAVLGLDRGRLLLQPDAAGLQLRLENSDGLRDLARVPGVAAGASANDLMQSMLAPAAHDLPRWLLLPAGAALRRRLLLPGAAAERLRDVVGFEIDRQTPFEASEVAYDARVLGRRESDGQLEVELVAVPRSVLADAETAIGDLRATLAGIDVADAGGVPAGVNLLPVEDRRQQADPMRGWQLACVAVALLACVALLWQWLQNRRAGADAFEQTVADQVEAARRVSGERQRLVDSVEGQAFLDRLRAGTPTAVEVLDDLTQRLPDGTYVEKFAIESERITVIGRSDDASSLVSRLEGSELWREPALTGALQPDPRTGRDIFTLTAELAVTGNQAEAARDAGQ